MSTQTTDAATIVAQLQQLMQTYQESPSQADAEQISQLAQEWLAATPNASSQLTAALQPLISANPQTLAESIGQAMPALQQQVTAFTSNTGEFAPTQGTGSGPTVNGVPTGAQFPGAAAPAPVAAGAPGGAGLRPGTPSPLVPPDAAGVAKSVAAGETPPGSNGVTGTGDNQTLTENGVTLTFNTAQQIIDSALQVVGLDPNQVATTGTNVGQTLGTYFWSMITSEGLTDPTTIGDMIGVLLPSTGQFQVAFPGYAQALANGYVRTVADYVTAEEGITAVMLQGGVPTSLINPTTVGNLIAQGVSTNEVAERVNDGLDAVENAPAEVQNYFAQEFGAQGPTAMATVFLNPNIDDVTLMKMLAGAQIQGAAAASNLTISQGLSQRLADQGQTYASASQTFKGITAQAGLFQQTVGEQSSQASVPGTQNENAPLTASNQGVEAAFGISSNAEQQVHQAALAREDEFRGGGGAATTEAEGFSGLSSAKSF